MDKFLRHLKDVGANVCSSNKLLHLKDLKLKKPYLVTGCRTVNTGFGRKLVLELNKRFDYFLPNRMTKEFTLAQMISAARTGRFYFKYMGNSKGVTNKDGKKVKRLNVLLFLFIIIY